jgi:peptide/nickel transport system ATP-binding protein
MSLSAAAIAPVPSTSAQTLLELRGLDVRFRTRSGEVHAIENLGFDLHSGETLGVVGESGSGKSVLSLALMGLLDENASVSADRSTFGARAGARRELIGDRQRFAEARPPIAMIFQSPRTALNPIRRVGDQLCDVLRVQDPMLGEPRVKARELLAQVKITDPERRLDAYPFELSGGMCQRVMIALALASRPQLLIADEPTTGLDVTTQAAIMALLRSLSGERGMSTLLITHDLHLAAESCDRLLVMHAGHVVEEGPTETLLRHPRHPYTAQLIRATPQASSRLADLSSIPGQLPDLRVRPLPACRFSERCTRSKGECAVPPVVALSAVAGSASHRVACRNPLPGAAP